METKAAIRKYFKSKRRLLTDEELLAKASHVNQLLMEFFEQHSVYKHIHVFIPMVDNQELDIRPLFHYLWSKDCVLYTSQMNYRDDQMDTVLFSSEVAILKDQKGIPFPENSGPIAPDHIQLVLVPLLAFDRAGNRLGYGKGYYDKFFSMLPNTDVFKLGVSMFDPIDSLPAEKHDIALDACVCPRGIMHFKN